MAFALLAALFVLAAGCQPAKRAPVADASSAREQALPEPSAPAGEDASGADPSGADPSAEKRGDDEEAGEEPVGASMRVASGDDRTTGGASDRPTSAPPAAPPAPARRSRSSDASTGRPSGAGYAGAVAVGGIPDTEATAEAAEAAGSPVTPRDEAGSADTADVPESPAPLERDDPPSRQRRPDESEPSRADDGPRAENDASAEPAVIWALRSPPAVEGAALTIPVMISSPRALRSVPFHLRFDPALLRFERVEAGALLDASGAPTVLAAPIAPGRVAVGLSLVAGAGELAGDGELARIVFTALAPGAGLVGFENARAIGPGLAAVEARFVGTGYTITSVTPGLERP